MIVFCSPKCLSPGDSLYDRGNQNVSHTVLSSREISKDLYSISVVSIEQGLNQEAEVSKYTLLPTWDVSGSLGAKNVSGSVE